MTADLLEHEGMVDLDSATLERTLSELWQQAARLEDGPPVARARVMTLVVYTEDDASAELAERVSQALPGRHPSRAVIVHLRPDAEGPLRASLAIQCATNRVGERTVCSEVIEVHAGARHRDVLADAVSPLLVADLPSVVWWTGRPRPADPVLRRFAGGLVDRVLLDSARFRDPGAGLIALARWREDPRRRAVLADLAWERLRQWRQLLAQTMDPPDARARLRSLREVTVSYAGEALPEEGLLLAGWLAGSLRWQPLDSPAFGVATFAVGGQTLTLRFRAEGDGGVERLISVRLRADDGAEYRVQEGATSGLAVCVAEGGDHEPIERLVPFVRREPVDLVVGALGRQGRDPVYEAALAAAAEIAVLGVTA
jgi:glucose-6-phosphate dehydrogenase assembly protein OpcA